MTDKEKRELKDGVISIFKRFNILDHTATIGGLRDNILRYIDSLQEEPALKIFESMLNAKTPAESLGISEEEYAKIEDKFFKEQEEPIRGDFEMALAEMIDKAQKCVVEPWVVAAQWKDELLRLAKECKAMQEHPKDCMYSKDNYTAEDRKILCEGCEEECRFSKED